MQTTKKLVYSNAFYSIIQVIISGVLLFILYKFLLKTLGSELFGLWALILGLASFSQFADFGFSASLTKFVAKYDSLKDEAKISRLIQTAIVSTAVSSFVVLLALYPLIKFLLLRTVNSGLADITLKIIPLSLISFWFILISNTIESSLDGLQLIRLKNLIIMFYSFLNCTILLTAAIKFGILGLAYSQIISSIIILILNWTFLRKNLKKIPFFPLVWEKKSFKEIINYSITFQASSIIKIFFEPTVKIFLARYNGLSFVSYFELGSKLIIKLRQLIISANYVLVPAYASLKEKSPEKISNIFKKSYYLIFFTSVLLFSGIILFSPLISKVWLGDFNKTFVLYLVFLSVAWFVSTINAPAYFLNLGTGELIWNLFSDIAVMVINISMIIIIGKSISSYGVIISWSLALFIGSFLVSISPISKKYLRFNEFIEKKSLILLVFSICYITIFLTLYLLPFFNNLDAKYPLIIIYTFPAIYLFAFLIIIKVLKVDLSEFLYFFKKK